MLTSNESAFFGGFSLHILGDRNLICLLQDEWKPYLQKKYPSSHEVALRLAEDRKLAERLPINGWFGLYHDGHWQAALGNHSRPYFTLEYGSNDGMITICVRGAFSFHVKPGLQYGLLIALSSYCIGLHGVTLMCGNEIIILSAPSGTGKTTLAKLLEKYCDAVVINGDFALLNPTENGVIFEPTPYCGSSRICLNHRVRVDRLVFLGQAKENHWRELDGREVLSRFMSNAFVPDWDKRMTQAVQKNILKCVSMLKVNAFNFAPTQEAAEMFLKKIE